jgi:hypothetical protein
MPAGHKLDLRHLRRIADAPQAKRLRVSAG